MIKVLIDTNILHEEGLNSTRVQLIQRLIKSGDLKLIIPEMVVNEYKSKRNDQSYEELQKIQSSLNNLQRRNVISKDATPVKEIINFVSSSIKSSDIEIDNWLKENLVDVYKISNTSIDDLFQRYFAGTGAFRDKKKREDIPDAVIYDNIEKISKDTELSVVAKDSVLIQAINKLENVKSYKSLLNLLELPQLKEKIEELNKGERKVKSILETLNTPGCSYDIAEYLREHELKEFGSLFDSDFVELPYDLEEIESSEHKARIKRLGDTYVYSPNYLGSSKFSLSVDAECTVELSFYCEGEQYELLPYAYRKVLSKEQCENRSEVYVSGILDARLNGVIVFSNIDENTNPSELKVHLSYLGAERCEIHYEINLEKLVVDSIY